MKTHLIISFLLFSSTTLFADDFRKADSFFDRDDSKGVVKDDFYGSRKSNTYDIGTQQQIKEPSKIVPDDVKERVRQQILERRERINESKPSTLSTPSAGAKVISLGIVVNSLDENHLERHLNTLIKTSTKLDLDINEVDFVGIDNDITKKFGLAIVSRFGQGNFMSAPPAEYNISTSPTWILQTENGQILLEGIDNPESYINSNAEFIDGGNTASYGTESNSSFFDTKNEGITFF